MLERCDGLQAFFDRGGPVLWAILLLSIVLWTLILERIWYYHYTLPRYRRSVLGDWEARLERCRRQHSPIGAARSVREHIAHGYRLRLERYLPGIETLTSVLPLLGLLGTVTGMIKTFQVMMVFGTENLRGLSAGISEALITTMAGLVTALSGLYFGNRLRSRAHHERVRLNSELEHCDHHG